MPNARDVLVNEWLRQRGYLALSIPLVDELVSMAERGADDTLAALRAAGLAVVPVVPTGRMIEDVCVIDSVAVAHGAKVASDKRRKIAREVWEVMLAAAPKP